MSNKNKDKPNKTGLVYVGTDGAHLTGFPATDLTPAECGKLDTKTIDRLINSGLYQVKENGSE